ALARGDRERGRALAERAGREDVRAARGERAGRAAGRLDLERVGAGRLAPRDRDLGDAVLVRDRVRAAVELDGVGRRGAHHRRGAGVAGHAHRAGARDPAAALHAVLVAARAREERGAAAAADPARRRVLAAGVGQLERAVGAITAEFDLHRDPAAGIVDGG